MALGELQSINWYLAKILIASSVSSVQYERILGDIRERFGHECMILNLPMSPPISPKLRSNSLSREKWQD